MTPLERARVSLEGLSVGDAFGEKFFFSHGVEEAIAERRMPERPWYWTDDTAMALSVYDCLEAHGKVVQDDLIQRFAKRYAQDPVRGYGPGAARLLNEINQGNDWRVATRNMFKGSGSFGNGAAMRVGPLGAYFAHDLEQVATQARLSAEVTHSHIEGIAGAIAVAVAAALALHWKTQPMSTLAFIDKILEFVPNSEVRSKLLHASCFKPNVSVAYAAAELGTGWRVTAQDTVPFCIWCAAQHMNNFIESMWATVSGLGDRDTTCAIVGSIIACNTGLEGIPQSWRDAREDFWV
jgi:ADP-ribosylglycohydrolase